MPAGRPRVLNDRLKQQIIGVLRAGGSLNEAAKVVGVARNTLDRECKRDKEFGASVMSAPEQGKMALVGKIIKAAERDWKAAAWMLERKFGREFAKNPTVAIHTPERVEVVNIRQLTDKELEAEIERASKQSDRT